MSSRGTRALADGGDARREARESERGAACERVGADGGDAIHANRHESCASGERAAADTRRIRRHIDVPIRVRRD